MKRSLFIILGTLCFAISGKAQGSDVSVQKKNTGYSILNDTVKAVKDSMTFEQRVEMIHVMLAAAVESNFSTCLGISLSNSETDTVSGTSYEGNLTLQ
jgi:hypothetical protein